MGWLVQNWVSEPEPVQSHVSVKAHNRVFPVLVLVLAALISEGVSVGTSEMWMFGHI